MFLRSLIVLLVIIAAEFAHGVLRTIILVPLAGDFRARQIAVFSGIAIILAISWFFIGWIGAVKPRDLLLIGAMWVGLMIAFELGLGLLLGFTWERMLEDYDLSRGGLLGFGMAGLFFAPLIAARARKVV